ncbi:MAG TPA: alpha/beta hydrolase, partial [Actinomycetota bacterium]|nr:alpha/beta hydrolase [Actinomycetota bacterium]
MTAATLRSDDGLALEAAIDEPGRPPVAAVVVCHPHPRMGGTMDAPLLLALRDALVARSWAVLRFNFRGVGASEGEASDGIAEVADARGALAEARRRWPDAPLALAGWSFGAAVAVRAEAGDHDHHEQGGAGEEHEPRAGMVAHDARHLGRRRLGQERGHDRR